MVNYFSATTVRGAPPDWEGPARPSETLGAYTAPPSTGSSTRGGSAALFGEGFGLRCFQPLPLTA